MRNYKKVLSCIIVISVLFCFSLVAKEAGISLNDNAPYIIVKHRNGDIESYKVENLLEESITIDNKYVYEGDLCNYVSNIKEIDASDVPASLYAAKDIDWNIKPNHTTYSTTKLNLSVGDTVTCSVTPDTSKDCFYNVGLWNNKNNAFASHYSVHAKDNLNTTNLSWTMAVEGSFSFAIKNGSDFSVRFSGSY